MSRYNFKFGDNWISELGVISTETPPIEIAERDCSMIDIPGKVSLRIYARLPIAGRTLYKSSRFQSESKGSPNGAFDQLSLVPPKIKTVSILFSLKNPFSFS